MKSKVTKKDLKREIDTLWLLMEVKDNMIKELVKTIDSLTSVKS